MRRIVNIITLIGALFFLLGFILCLLPGCSVPAKPEAAPIRPPVVTQSKIMFLGGAADEAPAPAIIVSNNVITFARCWWTTGSMGIQGLQWGLEKSTDLQKTWSLVQTTQASLGGTWIVFSVTNSEPHAFYRVRTVYPK